MAPKSFFSAYLSLLASVRCLRCTRSMHEMSTKSQSLCHFFFIRSQSVSRLRITSHKIEPSTKKRESRITSDKRIFSRARPPRNVAKLRRTMTTITDEVKLISLREHFANANERSFRL